MKFVQLLGYNMRNIFHGKSYTKCGGNQKIEHVSGSIVWSFIKFVFIVYEVGGYQNILKLTCRPLVFTSYKAFLKNKKRSGTILLGLFSAWFLKKNISLVTFC